MKLYLPLAVVAAVAVAQDFDAQAEAIVAKMTPAQWIGQMAQANIGVILGSDGQLSVNAVTQCAKAGVGSFLNGAMPAAKWRAMITQIQSIYKANNAPPALYGLDSVHGANYVNDAILSPQQINKGATFNAKIVHDSAFVTARDTSAGGVNWVFAPGLDVTNHKRWSRVYETFGEDPYLASELGVAAVNGIQSVPGVAAAVKHFIGYGATSTGDDRAPAYLDDYQVLNYHAPPFIAAIQNANALSVMASYVSVNGVPMVANSRLTNDLLRSDIGFKGLLLTDWEDIYNLNYVHKLVTNNQDAVAMSMSKSSVDMSMIPNDLSFIGHAQNLLNAGTIAASRYRASAKRIIKMKLQLGLFETPVPGANNVNLVGSNADRQASLDLARESIVLLKNKDKVLPVWSNPNLFVTGPAYDNIGYLCGGWTWEWQGVSGNAKFPGSQSVLAAFQSLVADKGGKVTSLQGVDINGGTTDSLADAKAKATAAEYTVIVVGEAPYAEMVGNIPDAALPAGQLQYIRDIASTGTKVILVLVEGRPRLLNGVADVVHAVIDAMLPCHMGGQAIAEIILGVTNPSGRLPLTYPKDATKDNMVTPYFHRKNGVCVLTGAACPAEWEFGAGLSYTTFEYSSFALSANQLNTSSESLTASVVVTNTGAVAGKEAVLVFLSQGARASGTPETKMLKKFTKVSLAPGQSTTVTFPIGFNDFAIYNGGIGSGLVKSAEAGAYYVGVKPETVCDANTIGPLCKSFKYAAVAATLPLSLYAKTTGKIVGTTDWDTFMYAPPTGATPANQQLEYLPDTRQLRVKSNGKCLDVYPNSAVAAGYTLHLWTCDAANSNQRWRINAAGHQIAHATHNNVCLDADPTDGQSRLQVWSCAPVGTNPNQFFGLTSVTAEPATLTSLSGLRFGANVGSGSVGFGSGASVWSFNFMTGQIVAQGSNQCLDAYQAQNGGAVHLWTCDTSNGNQKWIYEPTTGQLRHGTFKSFCLDMQSDAGATPYVWTCHDPDNYWFKFQTFKFQNTAVALP